MNRLIVQIICVTTIFAMLATLFVSLVPAANPEFPMYADKLASLGIINKKTDSAEYRLDDDITRAEMTKIALKIAWKTPLNCLWSVFKDVNQRLWDLCAYVEASATANIVSKTNVEFRPSDPVTRAEMIKMLLSAGGIAPSDVPAWFSDLPATLWDLVGFINAWVQEWCLTRNTFFHPNNPSSRGESFKIASCMADKKNKWKLVWSDEFNTPSLDMNKWTFETGGDGWGNHELEDYTDGANASIEGGSLSIIAKKEWDGKNARYTSTRIMTHNKAYWTYGKIEARIKLPYGKGMWPAFWMLGENIDTVGYPESWEIDIMEMAGGKSDGETFGDDIISGSLHRPKPWSKSEDDIRSETAFYKNPSGKNFSDDYHVFGIEWDPQFIRYYVDNDTYQTINIASKTDGYEVFQKPFYIILNLAIGGDMPGSPDDTTVWPQKMLVDWVRVYQR